MRLIADTHTHTIACDHAYSTLGENIAAAKAAGLRALAMTEHTPAMPGAPSFSHFTNQQTLPGMVDEILLLKGAEVNIMDTEGALDLPDWILDRLDWVIASFHIPNIEPSTREGHTRAWMAVAANPLVDVIGHCGDGRYAFDEGPVIREFARQGKIVEINAHSFSARPGSVENCPRIARLCAEEGVRVVVSTDAHFAPEVGRFDTSVAMLEEIGFPQELIVNADYDRFLETIRQTAGAKTREFLDTIR